MKFEIKHRFSGTVLFSIETDTFRLAVEAAVNSGADLSGANLSGADLFRADLSGANLSRAALSGAILSGADLFGANLFGANLCRADLSGANLFGANLCRADLCRADLSGADLFGANLFGANLFGADLRSVPEIKNIDAAILTAIENGGELNMRDWHTCNTTHCRAGWAVHLAGAGGAALEFAMGTPTAAALIYCKSRPGQKVPDFYCDTETAMADIRKCAAEQIAWETP